MKNRLFFFGLGCFHYSFPIWLVSLSRYSLARNLNLGTQSSVSWHLIIRNSIHLSHFLPFSISPVSLFSLAIVVNTDNGISSSQLNTLIGTLSYLLPLLPPRENLCHHSRPYLQPWWSHVCYPATYILEKYNFWNSTITQSETQDISHLPLVSGHSDRETENAVIYFGFK